MFCAQLFNHQHFKICCLSTLLSTSYRTLSSSLEKDAFLPGVQDKSGIPATTAPPATAVVKN